MGYMGYMPTSDTTRTCGLDVASGMTFAVK
jgi:hypothetical protein